MPFKERLEAFAFKYRGALWGGFAAALFIFPSAYSLGRFIGAFPLLVLGQWLRFWAAGIIPKYRTLQLDAPLLVTWGPYRWIRNPLYAGNALLGCGWSLMAGWYWVLAFILVYYALYRRIIIPYEERFLNERFGNTYLDYQSRTPALFPCIWGYSSQKTDTGTDSFDLSRSWNMEKHSLRMNTLVTCVVIVVLYLRARF